MKAGGKTRKTGTAQSQTSRSQPPRRPIAGGHAEVEGRRGEPFDGDRPPDRRRVGRRLLPGRPEVDREEGRRRVEELQPPRVPLRREVGPLRVVHGRAELGVVVEVPAGELRRRDSRREGVEKAESPVGERPFRPEDGPVDDLVEENRPVEDAEAEDDRGRDPDPEALDGPPGGEGPGEEERLPEDDREMADRVLPVELLQDLVRHGGGEPPLQVADRTVVVPGLHPVTRLYDEVHGERIRAAALDKIPNSEPHHERQEKLGSHRPRLVRREGRGRRAPLPHGAGSSPAGGGCVHARVSRAPARRLRDGTAGPRRGEGRLRRASSTPPASTRPSGTSSPRPRRSSAASRPGPTRP